MKNTNHILTSLGGTSKTRIAIDLNNLTIHDNIAILDSPFDKIHSSIEGIIDCFVNNFLNYFPKKIKFVDENDNKIILYIVNNIVKKEIVNKYFGFNRFDCNLFNMNICISLKNKIINFLKFIKNNEKSKVIFIRTIITYDPYDEIKQCDKLQNAINSIFSNNSKFIILFVIPKQHKTGFLTKLNNNAFIFTLSNKKHSLSEYNYILNYLHKNNLFNNNEIMHNDSIFFKKNTTYIHNYWKHNPQNKQHISPSHSNTSNDYIHKINEFSDNDNDNNNNNNKNIMTVNDQITNLSINNKKMGIHYNATKSKSSELYNNDNNKNINTETKQIIKTTSDDEKHNICNNFQQSKLHNEKIKILSEQITNMSIDNEKINIDDKKNKSNKLNELNNDIKNTNINSFQNNTHPINSENSHIHDDNSIIVNVSNN